MKIRSTMQTTEALQTVIDTREDKDLLLRYGYERNITFSERRTYDGYVPREFYLEFDLDRVHVPFHIITSLRLESPQSMWYMMAAKNLGLEWVVQSTSIELLENGNILTKTEIDDFSSKELFRWRMPISHTYTPFNTLQLRVYFTTNPKLTEEEWLKVYAATVPDLYRDSYTLRVRGTFVKANNTL